MSDFVTMGKGTAGGIKKKFFSVVNSPYKAGIKAGGDEATFSATLGFIAIDNGIARGEITNGNVIVVPDYIKFTCVTPAAEDGARFVLKTDIVNRYSSGGSSLTTLAANTFVDTYSSFERITAAAQIHAGVLTLTAESSAAALGVALHRSTQGAVDSVVGDELTLTFNGAHNGCNQSPSLGAMQKTVGFEPVFLGPGSSLVGHLVIDGATASVSEWKVEVGWHEYNHDYNA